MQPADHLYGETQWLCGAIPHPRLGSRRRGWMRGIGEHAIAPNACLTESSGLLGDRQATFI